MTIKFYNEDIEFKVSKENDKYYIHDYVYIGSVFRMECDSKFEDINDYISYNLCTYINDEERYINSEKDMMEILNSI